MEASDIRDAIGDLADGHDVAEDVLPFVRAAVLDACNTSDQGRQQFVVAMDAVALPNVDTEEVIWAKPAGERLEDDEVALTAIADPRLWNEARQKWERTDAVAWSAFCRRIAAPLARGLGLIGAWKTLAGLGKEAAASSTRSFVKVTYPQPGAGPDGRELPFVIGVIADLSGHPAAPLSPIKDRRFVTIDRASFAAVLAAVHPRLAFRVDNVLEEGQIDIELRFRSLEDFEPPEVMRQVEHLRRLAESGADSALSRQLDAVLQAPEFKRLEATWCGLQLLVEGTDRSEIVNLQVLDASKQALYRDLVRAREFDTSGLFKLVHDNIYGVFGPAPFGMLVSDAVFGAESADIEFLDRMAAIAAEIHAPFLATADYTLFNVAALKDMEHPTDPYKILRAGLYAKWRSLRESDDSRYLGLTFGSAVWLFASRIADSFSRHRTFTDFEEPWGEIAELACSPGWLPPTPDSLGFVDCAQTVDAETPWKTACLYNAMSVHNPKQYESAAATEASIRSAELLCVFTTARFAHYVKALLTDHPVPFASQEQCERALNDWIGRYVASSSDLTGRLLQAAHIHISRRRDQPCAVLRITPVYKQMEWPWSPRLLVMIPPGKIAPAPDEDHVLRGQ